MSITESSYFTRVACGIDIVPLVSELAAEPEMWMADTSRQRKVRCQRDTQNIFLRVVRIPAEREHLFQFNVNTHSSRT